MAYQLVLVPSELNKINQVISDLAEKAKPKTTERNTLLSIRKKCVNAIAEQRSRQNAAVLEAEILKKKKKFVPWKKLFFSLERKLGFDILAVRLNVPSYIAKSLSSGLVTPSIELQERILNLSAVVFDKTVDEVLDV